MLTIGLIYMPALLASKTFYQCPDVKRRCANPSPDYKRAAEDAKASYDADQAPYRLLSGAGLGLGLVLAGVSGYLFYRHVHSGGLAFGPLPSPSAMRALLPPSGFGERPVVFPLRL